LSGDRYSGEAQNKNIESYSMTLNM
jgi:hypothetical protein